MSQKFEKLESQLVHNAALVNTVPNTKGVLTGWDLKPAGVTDKARWAILKGSVL